MGHRPPSTLYYWSGVLLTVIATMAASAISGVGYSVGGTGYVNLSMFLAFAFPISGYPVAAVLLHPREDQMAGVAGYRGVRHRNCAVLLAGSWLGAILPVVALLNFLVFIWPAIDAFIQRRKYRHAPQTVNFKRPCGNSSSKRAITTNAPSAAARTRTIPTCNSAIAANASATAALPGPHFLPRPLHRGGPVTPQSKSTARGGCFFCPVIAYACDAEIVFKLLGCHGLMLEQELRHLVQLGAVLFQDSPCSGHRPRP